MTDIRQSRQFSSFLQDLGWSSQKIGSNNIYLRKFPFIGYFAKMPRPQPPFYIDQILDFAKKNKIFHLNISPDISSENKNYKNIRNNFLKNRFKIQNFPFNPTTTIQIDLTKSEQEIFNHFSQAKRRAVRRALKNILIVKESDNLEEFIRIRKKQYFPLGFLMVPEMKKLWKNYYPGNAALLLAYRKNLHNVILISPLAGEESQIYKRSFAYAQDDIVLPNSNFKNIYNKPLAGILLLIFDNIAYYWFASSLKEGKKLFAPTLLVWQALKLSKKRGCKIFEFEGIVDERFPKASESWKGFTKFKEGFDGQKIVFMENFYLKRSYIT